MTLRVRIYDPSAREQPRQCIGTLVLTDQRERACYLPEPLAKEAQFFLERVDLERDDAGVEAQIRAALQKPFVPLLKSRLHVTRQMRTRGVYTAQEPHGTAAYWRAAIGRLESEAGVTEDLDDYGRMLEAMEAAVLDAGRPEPVVVECNRA